MYPLVCNSEYSCTGFILSELEWKLDNCPTAGCPEAQTVQSWKYQCATLTKRGPKCKPTPAVPPNFSAAGAQCSSLSRSMSLPTLYGTCM